MHTVAQEVIRSLLRVKNILSGMLEILDQEGSVIDSPRGIPLHHSRHGRGGRILDANGCVIPGKHIVQRKKGFVCLPRTLGNIGLADRITHRLQGVPFPSVARFVFGKQRHGDSDASWGREGAFDAWL